MALLTGKTSNRIQRGLRATEIAIRLTRGGLPEVDLADLVAGSTDHFAPHILDDICMPPHVPGQVHHHDDYDALAKVARMWHPKSIVELGTAYGNTVANLCLLCPEAQICTVNAPASSQTGVTVTFSLNEDEIGRVYRAHGLGHRVTQVLCNTLDLNLGQWVQPLSVDLAIIDACHDTDFVLNDFLKVRPYIRPGGIVLMHDTGRRFWQHLAGSYLACLKLRTSGYEINHIKGTWWAYYLA